MDLIILANLMKMKLMVLANLFGVIRDLMKVNGIRIRCMEKGYQFGQIREGMKVNIKWGRKKAMENILGLNI